YTEEELVNKLSFQSGLKAYFNMDDIDQIIDQLRNETSQHQSVINAMTYQISKEIGAMAAALGGNVDGIVLTGHLAAMEQITNLIIKKTSWISDVFLYPGEYDIQALHEGALRVLYGQEKAIYYS